MRIAVVSNTGIPAVLPEDRHHWVNYGSESQNAVLVQNLARQNEIEWYAPKGSTTFFDDENIRFHPLIDSNGAHLQNELIENISFDGSKTKDILNCDFLIDASKQSHVSEELELWHSWKKSAQYRSGYQDWIYPQRIKARHVTHCEYFKEYFEKNGHPTEVCHFGLSDFWCHADKEFNNPDDWVQGDFLPFGDYFLYPHRPNPEKGMNEVIELARHFINYKFVIQTGLKFADHFREWEACKERCSNLPNVVFLQLPQTPSYQLYRRALMRNSLAVLSMFSESSGYMDTSGIVTCEAIRCGTPAIVTRGIGSEELLGELEDKGVTFVDGFESTKMAIRYKTFETRPNVDNSFMSINRYVEDWMNIIKKWS